MPKERINIHHILIVDDDALMRRSLSFNLEKVGFRVSAAANAEDALALASRDHPDLVLLDIVMPGMDGLDALRAFREALNSPIIFLTARRRELDEVLGLELGADDYVTKPFNFDVLLARIRLALRHGEQTISRAPQGERLVVGDLVLDALAHTVSVAGRLVELAPREFDLLHALARAAPGVVAVDELLASVWGAEFAGEPQVVYVHVRWLRQKIEDDPGQPRRLVTVHGVGYRLEPVGGHAELAA